MTDKRRQQLKDKVSAGEARNQAREEATLVQRAAQMRDDALELARDHPLLVVAGGIALGFAVSLVFKRSPTRKAGKKAARKASGLAALAAELALPLIQQALTGAREAGRDGLGRLEEFGETAGERTRTLRHQAAERAGGTIEAAQGLAKGAGKRIAKAVRSRAH